MKNKKNPKHNIKNQHNFQTYKTTQGKHKNTILNNNMQIQKHKNKNKKKFRNNTN